MHEDMDSYRINARAMDLIWEKVLELADARGEQRKLAERLGCHPATVNRWVKDRRIGENIPFREMIRYLDRLRIPLAEVFKEASEGLPDPSPDTLPTPLDVRISQVLMDLATALGRSNTEIARATGLLLVSDVSAMLEGRESMRASDFYRLCKAIGVAPEVVLTRAAELDEKDNDNGDKTAGRTA